MRSAPTSTPAGDPSGWSYERCPRFLLKRAPGSLPEARPSTHRPQRAAFHHRRRPSPPRFPANATGGGRFEQILRRRLVAHFGRCHGIRATILSTACHPGSVMNSI